jgi:hypothetical protein
MLKKFLLSFVLILTLITIVFPASTFAQTLNGISPRPLDSCTYSHGDIKGVVTLDCIPILFINLLYYALLFAGVVALFLVIFSGIKFITSGGDAKQLEGARKMATWAIIGLVVILMSFAMVRLVSQVTGVGCLSRFGFNQCATISTAPRCGPLPTKRKCNKDWSCIDGSWVCSSGT